MTNNENLRGFCDDDRSNLLAVDIARDAVIAAITTGAPVLERPGPAAAAVALRAFLPQAVFMSDGERTLLAEWLERLAKQ